MDSTTYWVVVPERAHDAFLEVKDPEGWREAYVRFDGCVGYTRHFNQPGGDGDSDSIHICDIDEEIARLQALKALAIQHFGEEWPWPH